MPEEFEKVPIAVTVNRKAHRLNVEPRLLLVEMLREELNLTGTHIGCETTYCGACTVLLNGASVKSCTVFAVQADQGEILTVEGLAQNGNLHPIQQAFWDNHGLQCGFCTPGMILTATEILKKNPRASEQDVRHSLEGNICRCTGYENIVKSIVAAQSVKPRKGSKPKSKKGAR